MNDERKRILRMLVKGSIGLDECEDLLDALQEGPREVQEEPSTPRVPAEKEPTGRAGRIAEAAPTGRPGVSMPPAPPLEAIPRVFRWHHLRPAVAALIVLLLLTGGYFLSPCLVNLGWFGKPDEFSPLLILRKLILPGLLIAWPVFWVWMAIDCLLRDRREFGMLITESHDKLVWVPFVILVPVVGAVAYCVVVKGRQYRLSNTTSLIGTLATPGGASHER